MSRKTNGVAADVMLIRTRHEALDAAILYRVMAVLTALTAVHRGRACLTRAGADYLGVEWPPPRDRIVWP